VLNKLARPPMGRDPDFNQSSGSRPYHSARLYATIWIFAAVLMTTPGSLASAGPLALGGAESNSTLLEPISAPDCAFRDTMSNPATIEETRMKLDYQAQCYRHAEMIVRSRLQLLLSSVARRAAVLLEPTSAPDCAFRDTISNPATAEETRMKLDYEAQCYRHAEIIVRSRLQWLQASIERRADITLTVTARPTTTDQSVPKSMELAEAQRLVGIGDRHIAQGNIAIARGYYVRAAELGLAIAAMKMAETHDPRELARWNVRGVKPDLAEAKRWYQRALELEASGAEARLRRLSSQ